MRRRRGTPVSVETTRPGPAAKLAPAPAGRPSIAAATAKPIEAIFGRTEPTRREISQRAYFIYLSRGGVNGDSVSDWVQAERELREELRATARAGRRF